MNITPNREKIRKEILQKVKEFYEAELYEKKRV